MLMRAAWQMSSPALHAFRVGEPTQQHSLGFGLDKALMWGV